MRAVLQRVRRARVTVHGEVVGEIGPGLAAMVGVARGDTQEDAEYLAKRTAELRIFADEASKFNRSAQAVGAELLVVSQFPLLADTRKGRRPSFSDAAPAEEAERLVGAYAEALAA